MVKNTSGVSSPKEADVKTDGKATEGPSKTELEAKAPTFTPEPKPDTASKAKDDAAVDEPKVGKVEARLAALEAYVKDNAKALGWPEFKG